MTDDETYKSKAEFMRDFELVIHKVLTDMNVDEDIHTAVSDTFARKSEKK